MAKVTIKSDKATRFGNIFAIMEKIDSLMREL